MKEKNKAVTYSLLSHIRNKGDLAKGPIDIFLPLIKKAISTLNNEGIYKGANISEIKEVADKLYSLDFPIPVLRKILHEIKKEVNTDEVTNLVVHNDDSFQINEYTFYEFDELISGKKEEIDQIEELYVKFKETASESEIIPDNIFKFIENNKHNLSKFFSEKGYTNGEDYTIEAQFVNYFKSIPSIYEIIKDIYLGSIIACYIEYQPEINKNEVELILDTNFIVGLLDLNTPESTHTCRTLIKVSKANGYKISVLKATIEETENLLKSKAINFDKSFLQKKINPEDVYNACDRRSLNKSDLERISDNIEKEISKYEINIYYSHDKLTKEAKFTSDYEELKKIRNSEISALHDATAILYVTKKRGKPIKEFDKVNCWFVNNSTSYFGEVYSKRNGNQPVSIKADDLLNILWLSSPSINKSFASDDLINIGLTSTISLTLNRNLPKSKVLRDLDDNLCKYAKDEISDEDIVRISKRITNKQLTDIEELNNLAENDKENFVKRLNEEANKQKEIEEKTIKKLDAAFKAIKDESAKYKNARKDIEGNAQSKEQEIASIKKELVEKNQELNDLKISHFIEEKVKKWRRKTIGECVVVIIILIGLILFILYTNNFDLNKSLKYYNENIAISILISLAILIANGFAFKSLYDKYRNHSNIENFKKNIKIPKDL